MAFTAKILSWRFRHLNIVGCLIKRRPTKGGSRAPQDPPSYAPVVGTYQSAAGGCVLPTGSSFLIVLDLRHASWPQRKGCHPSLYPALPLEVYLVTPFLLFFPRWRLGQDHCVVGYDQARLSGHFPFNSCSGLKFRKFHVPNGMVHSGCTYPSQATACLVIVLVRRIQKSGTEDNKFVEWNGTFRSDRQR